MIPISEYELNTTFSKALKTRLKQELKGEIVCKLFGDTLYVTIYGVNDIIFKYTWYNLTSEIVQGLTSERLSQIIVKRYRQYITNLFFF